MRWGGGKEGGRRDAAAVCFGPPVAALANLHRSSLWCSLSSSVSDLLHKALKERTLDSSSSGSSLDCVSEEARGALPSLISLMVSVDVKPDVLLQL